MTSSIISQPDPIDQATFEIADHLYRARLAGEVDRESLRSINRSHGTDVATALLYRHFRSRPMEIPFLGPKQGEKSWMIVIVPGAFHKEHPEIGGDGREIRDLAKTNGWRCETVPTASLGTTAFNAESIIQFLNQRTDDHQILTISLSKGTTDLIAAVDREPSIVDRLMGWISISGVPCGTLMADWLLDRWRLRPILNLMCWKLGADKQAVRDLRHAPGSSHQVFQQIPCIHVAGFPLQRHLSNWRSRLWHRRLRSTGPNDSVVLLEDLLGVSGTVLPIWGADHYLKTQWDLRRVTQDLVNKLTTRQSA
ncbi:MAG: hypothetical protein KDB00_11595 [Planctomycetales bacterium]|nr:hypothetical protein [Planctomycetales bacterium]